MWCGKWLHNDDGHVEPHLAKHRDCHVATLEHILAKEDGGGDELSNLGIACIACNKPKHRTLVDINSNYASDVLDREARHLYHTPV